MDDALHQLYQETLLHHSRHPRNFGSLPPPPPPFQAAEGFNPLCGDRLSLQVRMNDDHELAQIAFQGAGCAISLAAASLMTEAVKGKTQIDVENLSAAFTALCRSEEEAAARPLPAHPDAVAALGIFSGVRAFPMRVKCATLAWHTLRAALHGQIHATTE